MHFRNLKILVPVFLLLFFTAGTAAGFEIQTRYATIEYENAKDLQRFNRKLRMGSLGFRLSGKKNETVEDEVRNKIDVIVDKAGEVLQLYPANLKFKIVIRKSQKGVWAEWDRLYYTKEKFIAFYSPGENTVFYSSKNINIEIVAHEIGHVIAENYFERPIPRNLHEMMAKDVQRRIKD